jgi:chromate transporter
MAVVTIQLARGTLIDPIAWAIAAAALVLLLWKKINSAWLILAGGLLGIALGYR